MVEGVIVGLTVLAALGSWIVGGIFYGFSSFVMRGLGRLPAAQGIAAMQSINVTVFTPWFMGPFIGTAVLGAVLIVASFGDWREPEAIFRVAGSVLYLVGCFLVTGAFNVPRNNVLADVSAESPGSTKVWADYVPTWTRWNTVRTIAALTAGAAYTISLSADGAEWIAEALGFA